MAGRVLALPNQTPGLIEQHGLTRAEVDSAVWVIDAAGRRWAGAAAANRALKELGGGWVILAALYALPPVCWLEDRVYRWIAAHRGQLARWWSATPECDEPDISCR
jgi:predicted DCC family thiol-disulfide oxidoreductase YuxK